MPGEYSLSTDRNLGLFLPGIWLEREGEGGREVGREGGREGERERGREGERERGREGERVLYLLYDSSACLCLCSVVLMGATIHHTIAFFWHAY